MGSPARRLLLAGSGGPERRPARHDPDDADWFLPLHVRDETGARERIAARVAAGADVVVAATWLTHRRALLPLGETRRAREWTAAAVRIARQGVEVGLERRAERPADAQMPDDGVHHGRPEPLLAASLPALGEETGSGRLLPREAATERDYRDQAGLLGDAEPDVLLVEGQRRKEEARAAISEALRVGLPVWVALEGTILDEGGLEAWVEWCGAVGVACMLAPGPFRDVLPATGTPITWGGLVKSADEVGRWLEAGANIIARLDGASPAVLEPLRAAIDDFERAELEVARAGRARWRQHVARAAAMAPGGAAAWVGPSLDDPLPPGFEWLVIEGAGARHLPSEHYRLVVVAPGAFVDTEHLLERGGILAAPPGVLRVSGDLRLVVLDESADPPLGIFRREP